MAQLSPLTRDWSRKRELDEALGLTATAGDMFRDPRHGKNTQHELGGLPRQSVYSRLAGYEDTNDAERLSVDPAMRHVVGGRPKDRQGASASQMGRFQRDILTGRRNRKVLTNLPRMWIDRVRERRALAATSAGYSPPETASPAPREASPAPREALPEASAGLPAWCGSTTVAGPPSSRSRKVRTRSSGPSFPATTSWTTRFASNCLLWRTTWATSFDGWHCRRA